MEERDKIMAKILAAENERRLRVNALKQELHELEAQGEMCGADRIIEIIDELNLIDPLGEDEEPEKRKEQEKLSSSKPKRKRFRFTYAVAAGVLVALWLGFEAISVTSFNNNFFDGTTYLSKAVVGLLTGTAIQQDGTERSALGSKIYKTIEQLEKTEKIDIICPTWLPDDTEIENIRYDKSETSQIHVQYDDKSTLLLIKLDFTIPIDSTEGAIIYEDNDIKFYVFTNLNMIMWEYNEDFYNLSCKFDVNEYAEKIIENIK